jgi:S-adenosylmethionine:tRNA ribosyltransferase-isomerase
VERPAATAEAVNRARREGRPVIAVGTTSIRTLEGVFAAQRFQSGYGDVLAAHSGWINIFLYPGQPIQITDGLITNFHLPESSLLMLVSALAGRERILSVYARALAEGFRFFSYGDAMLIV